MAATIMNAEVPPSISFSFRLQPPCTHPMIPDAAGANREEAAELIEATRLFHTLETDHRFNAFQMAPAATDGTSPIPEICPSSDSNQCSHASNATMSNP